MIRIWLENGKPALFDEWEPVTVCADILNGEYLVGDRTVQARDLLKPKEQRRGIGYALLDLENFRLEDMMELCPVGVASDPDRCRDTVNVYRVVKIDRGPDRLWPTEAKERR